MANSNNPTAIGMAVAAMVAVLWSSAASVAAWELFPRVEVTLANDGENPVWFMCQDNSKSLYELRPNSTYRFSFDQVAFPMRWCYLYINPRRNGFFWAYTVRSSCTKCFWSIDRHPSLYRNDKGRWERRKLFMPPYFDISDYLVKPKS